MNIDLEKLKDEELHDVIARAQALLEERKKAARQKAIEDAQAALAAVGLTFRDVNTTRSAKKSPLPQGQKYVNPDDPSQVWVSGRGRRPKWLAALDAQGKMPKPR